MKKVTLDDIEKHIKEVEAKTKENPDCSVDIMKMTDLLMSITKPNIQIFTDYDTDGITSGYILEKALSALYGDAVLVNVLCNDRRGSYGVGSFLNMDIDPENTQVIILDMGSNEYQQIVEKFGSGALVIDHHIIEDEKERLAARKESHLLNPKMYDNPADYCTAGLAYRVFYEMVARAKEEGLDDKFSQALKNDLLVMSAIGSCADVVNLLDENSHNREIVKGGLTIINNKDAELGFTVSKILDKTLERSADVTAHILAFNVGAFLNAGGRMSAVLETNGSQMIMETLLEGLLDGDDEEYSKRIVESKMDRIAEINDVRKSFMTEIKEGTEYRNAVEYYSNNDESVVLYILDKKYPHNFCGLVAGALADATGKACICLQEKEDFSGYTGSGRNVKGNKPLHEYMKKIFEGMDVQFGGHSDAIGISHLMDIAEFEARLAETPIGTYDIEMEVLDVNLNDPNLLKRLYALEPIGQGITIPPVLIEGTISKTSDISSKKPNGIWKNLTVDGVDLQIKDWNYKDGKFIKGKNGEYLLCDMEVNVFRGANVGLTITKYPKNFEEMIANPDKGIEKA